MNPAGWTVMILSVGSVLTLVCYCLYRVLTLPPVEVEESLRAPPDIDTGDLGANDYSTVVCKSCRQRNEARAKFCAHCGQALQ